MNRWLHKRSQDLRWLFWLSRPNNVLITALTYTVCAWIGNHHEVSFCQHSIFWQQGGILLAVTASGYWINDIFDYKIDRINRPGGTIVSVHISPKKVWTYYCLVCGLAVGASFQLPWKFQVMDGFALAALYAYAYVYKRKNAVGNLIISLLSSLVVVSAALLFHFTKTLVWLSIFAFWITFIRELTKDIEDLPGDVSANLETLPIQLGIRGAKSVLRYSYIVLLVLCNMPFLLGESDWKYLLLSGVLVQIPTVYTLQKLIKSTEYHDFSYQSRLLKWIMLSGLLSFVIYDIIELLKM